MTTKNKLFVIITPNHEVMKMSVADNEKEAWKRACLLTQSNTSDLYLTTNTSWFARCWRACGSRGDLHTQAAIEIGTLMGYRIAEAEVTAPQYRE